MLLDGSLIVFLAAQANLSCPDLFTAMAVGQSPATLKPMATEIHALAEEACKADNPDEIWMTAMIRTRFRTDTVVMDNGTALYGKAGREYLDAIRTDPLLSRERYESGIFLLPGSKYTVAKDSAQGRGAAQVRELIDSARPKFVDKCGLEWIRCAIYGSGGQKSKTWNSARKALAKRASEILEKDPRAVCETTGVAGFCTATSARMAAPLAVAAPSPDVQPRRPAASATTKTKAVSYFDRSSESRENGNEVGAFEEEGGEQLLFGSEEE